MAQIEDERARKKKERKKEGPDKLINSNDDTS